MSNRLDLSYPAILSNFGSHLVSGRTEARAFLAWFLEHYYRLEETDAQDAVCDGPDDKGVDGIYVDENLERIEILQSKLFQNQTKTLGDTTLKEFVGSIDQFRSADSIERIAATTSNTDLARLIRDKNLATLLNDGFEVHGVLVTNASRDGNATSYLQSRTDITLFDGPALDDGWVPIGPSAPIALPVTFDVTGYDLIQYRTPEAYVVVAPLLASELVTLGGLQSGELFVWNVRQSLGRTKVNKAIAESVRTQQEHKNFLLYHNGLTMLCEKVASQDGRLRVEGYTVVNGCQSLTTLFENRQKISSELRVLARLIQLSPEAELAAKITRHSNNQNAINARDLQSNSTIQRRLQSEFAELYGGEVGYEIKRGEQIDLPLVIANDEAARIVLAFDLEQPWTCHQTYKLFDELHSDIFGRPEVNASRIRALYAIYETVVASLPNLRDTLMGGYRLTRFFLLYLLRKALETDTRGKEFVRFPQAFVSEPKGIQRIEKTTKAILGDLVVDLNAELQEKAETGAPFDYKRELKSPTAVKAFAQQIVPMYEKALRRGRVSSFSEEWQAST